MNYKKSIIVLMSGSAAAQAIPILVSPILTRLYTPKEFGVLALFLSLTAVFSVFAAGRYDLALIEPAEDKEARGLLFAGLRLNIIFCLFLFAILVPTAPLIAVLLGSTETASWLNLVPITVFSMTCMSIFTYWLNRRKKFKGMNTTRILNSIGIAGLSLGFAFTTLKPYGLLLGYMLGQLLTVSYQWFAHVRTERQESRTEVWPVMQAYARYPRYLIPSTLAGTVAAESPFLLLTRFFDSAVAGLFSFMHRVTISPMAIIGNSVGEAYRVRASEYFQKHGECRQIFLVHVRLLAVAGFVPWLVLFLWGPELFVIVFGPQWREAGEMATIFSFVLWFQLVSTPLSYTITFNRSQNLDLYLQIFRVSASIGSLLVGHAYEDYMLAIQIYSVTYCLYYLSNSFIQYRAAKGKA
jgi:O-antigen/teichoic acid export membrane protein